LKETTAELLSICWQHSNYFKSRLLIKFEDRCSKFYQNLSNHNSESTSFK